MNLFDRLISVFSPGAALARVQARFALESFRRYDAANLGGKNKGWRGGGTSATSEIRASGHLLRERSREQVRNNPYGRRPVLAIPASVVGSGIMPSIRSTGSGRGGTAKIKKMWRDWAETAARVDYNERKTFAAIQSICMRAMLESGEVFVIRRVDAKKKDLQLQVLEADFLDTLKDGIQLRDGGYIIQGIEFDSSDKRVAYWLFKQHPGEALINSKFVSERFAAADVIHLYDEERPGQQRGVPNGMSSIIRSRDYSEYQDAQLIRQKIAACFAVFISKDINATRPGDGYASTGDPIERVTPGIIERLKPGESVSFGNPPTVEGADAYASTVLHEIAAGYDIPYEILTGDYSRVNFSSARMARMEFSRRVMYWQEFVMIPVLCQRVFQWRLDLWKINGEIPQNADITCGWTSPALEFIDPLKEANAMVAKVRGGLMSWQEAVRQLGYDPEEVLEELKTDATNFTSAGLMPFTDPRFDVGRKIENDEPTEE